jgi:hypothetical protein
MSNVRIRKPNGLFESFNIETLDEMPFSDYAKKFQGRIKGAVDHDRYDTLRIEPATTVAKGVRALFTAPRDSDAKTASGTAIVKDRGDTNMVEANKMEYGNIMIVESIQAQVVATSRDFAAIAQGEPTDLSAAAPATDTVASSNTVIGLADNTFLQFRVGDDVKAEGILTKFPCEYSFSGAYGADAQEGFTQLGNGRARLLKQIVILKPGQHFSVDLDFLRAMLVPQSVGVRIYLSGIRLSPVG